MRVGGGGLRNPRAGAAADRPPARRAGGDGYRASGDAPAAATATAPTGGLNETVGWRRRSALPTRRHFRQVVAAAAGLLGAKRGGAAARRRRGRRALRRAVKALDGRARLAGREGGRAVRRGAARACATAGGRRSRPTGRGWRSARRGTCATRGQRRPARAATAAGDSQRRRGRAGVGPVRGRREAAPRRDGQARRRRRRRHRGAVAGVVDDEALVAARPPSPRRGRRRARRSTRAARRRSAHHPTDVIGAWPAGRRRLPRGACRRGGQALCLRRRATGGEPRTPPGNGIYCAAPHGRGAAATARSPTRPCTAPGTTGARLRHLPAQLHRGVGTTSGRVPGTASPGGRLRRRRRRGTRARETRSGRLRTRRGTRCPRRRARTTAATTARSFAKAYLRNLVGPVDPEKSAVILGFLGVVVFASALAAICGHRLDKRDATLRRGRRLVLSHSSSFLLGASTRDLAKTLGDKRATHGGAPPLIHLPGSRPRTSPNDEEAASPADERGADLLAAGWRAASVHFRGAFRPKSSSRAQVAPLRRRVSAAAPADDGVAEGLQGSAAAGRADHRVGGADRHAHGGRGARDAAGVPGPEVRRAKVGPEMSKVHGGLQRPRALPVGRRERDLQRQPAAGRRLWRLFAPAGGALRHRDHAAVPEGVRVGRARRPGADLALLGAPVARRRGCGRAGRARCRRTSARARQVIVLASAGVCRFDGARRAFPAQAHEEGAARELGTPQPTSTPSRPPPSNGCAPSSAVRAGGRAERPPDPGVQRARAGGRSTPSLGGGGGGAPPRPEDDAPPASPAARGDAVSASGRPAFAAGQDMPRHARRTAPRRHGGRAAPVPSQTRRRPASRPPPAGGDGATGRSRAW